MFLQRIHQMQLQQEKIIDTATSSNIQPIIINFVSTNYTLNAELLWALGAFVPIIHLIINPMLCKFFKRCFQDVRQAQVLHGLKHHRDGWISNIYIGQKICLGEIKMTYMTCFGLALYFSSLLKKIN